MADLQSAINGTSAEPLIIAAAVVGRVVRGFQTVARTTLQHAHSVAATDFYKENSDLIKYEEFSAILDNKTSAVCRSLSGRCYPLGKDRGLRFTLTAVVACSRCLMKNMQTCLSQSRSVILNGAKKLIMSGFTASQRTGRTLCLVRPGRSYSVRAGYHRNDSQNYNSINTSDQ